MISIASSRSAIIAGPGDCWRYELRRVWNPELPPLVVCMPLAKLPALAARLGVPPRHSSSPSTVTLYTHDGLHYDLFDLINAVLDRLDAASPPTGANK